MMQEIDNFTRKKNIEYLNEEKKKKLFIILLNKIIIIL